MQKEHTLQSAYAHFEGRERLYDGFENSIFLLAPIEGTRHLE